MILENPKDRRCKLVGESLMDFIMALHKYARYLNFFKRELNSIDLKFHCTLLKNFFLTVNSC